MEPTFKQILAYIFFVLVFLSCKPQNTEKQKDLIAIINTAIVDVSNGEISEGRTILINNGLITKIEQSNQSKPPSGSKIINGAGKYVIPGLWDMHAHTSSKSITQKIIYPSFIANGVTGIRVLSGDCFEPCWELQMNIEESRSLQREVEGSRLVGPRAIFGSTIIHGSKPGDTSSVIAPGNKEDGRKLVSLLKERGVDFIKIYNEIPREAYFGIADEAKEQGLAFAGHVPVAVRASEASDAGQKSIEHCCAGNLFEECSTEEEILRGKIIELIQSREAKNMNRLVLELVQTYDEAKCQQVFRKLLENNTFFTPTLIATEVDNILSEYDWKADPRLKYLPRKEYDFWIKNEEDTKELLGVQDPVIREKRFEIVGKMNKAGVKLLAGSDCGVFGVHYGFGLHDELELLVEAGLTELEALQTATLNPADFNGNMDSFGQIKEGLKADLVLINENPLSDIRNTRKIFGVISNGNYYDRKNLDRILEKIKTEVAK